MTKRIGIAVATGLSLFTIAGVAAPVAGAVGANFSGATPDATSVYFVTDERLLAADTDSLQDVYSSSGGVISLVSAPGVGASGAPKSAGFSGASADGTKVFFSTAESLVTADTDTVDDVYERSGGTTTLVSVPGVGSSGSPAAINFSRASADGSKVFLVTSENLVTADTDGFQDVYERSGGTTTLTSVEGVGSSGSPTTVGLAGITSDGSKVFLATTENFIAGDTDGKQDFFERSGGSTSWITAPEAGGEASSGTPFFGGFSADGSKVFFTTEDALIAGDTDGGLDDVYMRSGGTTTLISEAGVGGSGPAGTSSFGGTSSDGSKVIFSSQEDLVAGDADGFGDLYERSGGTTTLVSAPGAGATGPGDGVIFDANSTDGGTVFWETEEALVGSDVDGLFDVYKRSGGTTTLASPEGAGASGPFNDTAFDRISADGSVLLFETDQNMVGADTDGLSDVYQNTGGVTTLVTVPGAGANGPAEEVQFRRSSTDATRVILGTDERLTSADGDSIGDLYERFGGDTTLLSGEPGPPLGSPPETTISSGPPASTTETAASFSFSASESPVTFECRMDGGSFTACTSPFTASGLGVGAHTFEVRATDFALNVDPTPASHAFTLTSPPASAPTPAPAPAPTAKKCKKGQKLKKGKCVKKKHRK
jgi:hypothetical protein